MQVRTRLISRSPRALRPTTRHNPRVIDLHAHVLPGIDDGPDDLKGSLALLCVAAERGTRVIAATPHLRSDHPRVRVEELAPAVARLQREIPCEWNLRIAVGAEIDLLWAVEADDAQLRLASLGQRGHDLLLETPYGSLPPAFEHVLADLRARGYRVLLAHPERSPAMQRDPARLRAIVASGVLLQVTASSLLDTARRSPPGRLARALIGEGLVHVLASDAHSAGPRRAPGLGAAVSAAGKIDARRAGWMVTAAPAAILVGAPLPPLPPLVPAHARRRSRRS